MRRDRSILPEWRDAIRDSDLTVHRKAVGWALSTHMNGDGSDCFPGVRRIAKDASVTQATVVAAISDLEQAGLLHVVKGRGRSTSEYHPRIGGLPIVLHPVEHNGSSSASRGGRSALSGVRSASPDEAKDVESDEDVRSQATTNGNGTDRDGAPVAIGDVLVSEKQRELELAGEGRSWRDAIAKDPARSAS